MPHSPSSQSFRGFTLIELLVVVALIGIASALTTLALRDPSLSRLETEAGRLVALLESARSQARATGLLVRWVPQTTPDSPHDFQFIGLPAPSDLPTQWLEREIKAQVKGASALVLGPEPIIGPQQLELSLGDKHLSIGTDGLGPFTVQAQTTTAQ